MKEFRKLLTMLAIAPILSSCSTNLAQYQDNTPAFSMAEFFTGQLCAKGLVRNRDASVNRKFIAEIKARSSHEEVILDEQFVFDDGEKQQRIWIFKKQGSRWSGSAGDVVGNAVGKTSGDTLHLTYQLKITSDGDEVIVDMDDWLHLVDENTLMGSTNITKWGFDVGQIDLFIQKQACSNNKSKVI